MQTTATNLKRIELISVLPKVFISDEKEQHIIDSQVWLKNIVFEKGKYYSIEAESGTGKSSLCSFIYGNRSDYDGSILFDGKNVRDFSILDWCRIRQREIALLPQEMRIFPELTALENIQIKNRLTDFFSESEILNMLDCLEIRHKSNSLAGNLSVGQQQRVAIVRALCQPFSFLLLDEPVSHLDQRNNRIAADLILSHAEKQNAAVISTSVGNPLLLSVESQRICL